MFEKPDAVGEEGDIEGDDEAAIGDDPGGTKGADHDGVAKEGGVIKNEGELRLVAQAALEPPFVEDEFGEDDEDEHDKDAGD